MALLIALALAVLAAAALFLLRKPRPPAPPPARLPRTPAAARPAAQAPVDAATPAAAPGAEAPLPPELVGFRMIAAEELATPQREALLAQLRTIPRPPRSLQQLISPDFVSKVSSAELSELVMAEPVVAARVLAAVNSSLYGLQRPVTSIGQAVTFLGLNSVRAICLQYMLDDSFKTARDDAGLKAHFDALWRASTVASELCQGLAQKLQWAEPGALVTHVVLSFLGQFASAALLQRQGVAPPSGAGLFERLQLEQERLGLGAAELGVLLMQEWALPPSIVEDVRGIDRILVTPAAALDPQRGARLALCYLSARLGERIAQGQLGDLAGCEPAADESLDFHQLRSYLARPALARLAEFLQAPDLQRTVQRLAGGAGPARI